ncbi:long-chain-fatty-acid--CoA ligase [Mumia sp. DW29H23]|uniref:long-chain-fatty-acid--CoA ligase n=1 Tax=Mumia sp. DW29H23 TaxID=3421241 RepID=UPI003D688FB0
MKELVFPRLLVPTVERVPDRVAVVAEYDDGTSYEATFAQHLDRVLRLKRALAEGLGVGPQGRFAVIADNSHRYLELWHAALFGAGVINPLNARLALPELDYILNDSQVETIFVDSTYAPVVEKLRDTTALRTVVLMDDGDGAHDLRYEDLLAAHAPADDSEPDEDDVAVLMYTGGTSGKPKGVQLTHRAEALTVYRMDFAYRYFGADDVFLMNTPMFHVAGCLGLMGMPAAGSRVVILPRFDPGTALAAIEKHRVTRLGVVSMMLAMLMAHPDFTREKVASVRAIAYGGSPMPEDLMRRLGEEFPRSELFQIYGMTEMAAVLTELTPADHRAGGERTRSAGRALPGVRMRICDPGTGEVLPTGEVGEIVVQSGAAMTGYWNLPEETAQVLRDGWYYTGDMGRLDDEGYLYVTDRLKDMIVTGGENVYSIEVENALSTHPAVAQVAVIGVPSSTWGEAVHAVVMLRPGQDATEQELIDHVRARIAAYKAPKSVELRTEPLPMSAAAKILKRELRASYVAP